MGIRAKGKRSRNDSMEYFDYAPMKKRRRILKEGDIINLSQILFTEDRDFLIKNNGQQVHAEHLKDKVIVLHFVPLVPLSSNLKLCIKTLADIYKSLVSKSVAFEVVFIGFKVTKRSMRSRIVSNSSLQKYFDIMFSIMPWTGIPFSDIKTLNYWENLLTYPIHHFVTDFLPLSLVIDPTGMVSQLGSGNIFLVFGAEAYPFTDKRIRYLQCQDDKALDSTSISKLLTSHGLDHVINNENQKVHVKDLEGKVVALFFYEDFRYYDFDDFKKQLKKTYDDLKEDDKNNFEIVLVYLHDSIDACKNASKASFWTTLHSMPWLALPYKDPRCKNLKRIFEYPCDLEASESDPRLAIIGPHGTYVEPYGADILKLFKYATSAYPFTRSKAAELDVENLKHLSLLDIFKDPDPSFDRAYGQVKLSQLAGKKILLIIEDGWPPLTCHRFFSSLKKRYRLGEEMGDPFEVIHAPQVRIGSLYVEYVSSMPWLSCRKELYKREVVWRHLRGGSGLLAFDGDGRVVRKTIFPRIQRGNMCFPFYDGGLEEEALKDLIQGFQWYDSELVRGF